MALVLLFLFLTKFAFIQSDSTASSLCAELTQTSLEIILGQAFNPRYMSIAPPGNSSSDTSLLGSKRSSNEIAFYVDDDVVSVGDFPAWEANHLNYFEMKKDAAKRRKRSNRYTYFDRTTSRSELFKSRPWECSSRINWIDLGPHYFPRYIRSVECTAKKCWYGHFSCKPRSFTVKVLRRRHGSCARVNERLVVMTHIDSDFTELWIWEEVAINFCCECVMIYL